MKLEDYLEPYVTYLVAERDASPYTVKNYSHEIGEFIEFAHDQGVTQLEQIDRHILRLYLTWLAAEKKARGSIARRLSELRSFGNFLVRAGALKANVFDTVSAPKLGQRLPEYLEHDEAAALVTAPDTVPFCAWMAAHHSNDFKSALAQTIRVGGDCDTNAAIVGGIVAVSAGHESIPTEWLNSMEQINF